MEVIFVFLRTSVAAAFLIDTRKTASVECETPKSMGD
jgi:hypothetical protein